MGENNLNEEKIHNEGNEITVENLTNENDTKTEPEVPKKSKKKAIIIIAILVLVIAGLVIGFVLSNKKSNSTDVKEDETNNKSTKKEEIPPEKKDEEDNDQGGEGKSSETTSNLIEVYEVIDSEGNKVWTSYKNEGLNPKLIFSKKSEASDLILDSLNEDDGLILYRQGETVNLYNVNTKKESKLNINGNYYNYGLIYDSFNKELLGITYYKKFNSDEYEFDNLVLYNLKTNKEDLENKYSDIIGGNNGYISASEDYETDEEEEYKAYLIDINKNYKVIKEVKDECPRFEVIGNKNNSLILEKSGCYDLPSYELYTFDNKLLFSGDEYEFEAKESNVQFLDNKKLVVMDYSGKEIKKSKEYDKTIALYHDYFVAVKNNKIYVGKIDGFEKELGTWNKNYEFNAFLSGYYMKNEDKEEGLFIVFNKDEDTADEYYFYPGTGKTGVIKDIKDEHNYAKPVLYLYPTKKTKVNVTFDNPSALTTTYPKFKNSWNVTAYPSGDLYDKNGNYYYALYWEEKENHNIDFKEGFYVTKDNAIKFLEEKLSLIGLNAKEKNEFIMYWLPILEKNEKNLVYFELTEERNNYNKLNINPKPDSMLRVAIHVKKVNKYTKVKEQKLTRFNRVGFTAVEWGGTVHK